MALIINEEQQMLKQSAKEFLKDRAPIAALRKLRDDRDETGYDKDLWQEMAEMGWASLTIAEDYGGLDFGYVGLGQILEEMGRTLTASPMVSTILLSTTAISLAGSEEQKQALLPAIAEGNITIAMAIDEKSRHNPSDIQTTATKTDSGYAINGKKVFVLDGHVANQLLVVANTENGQSLFLVDASAEGVSRDRRIMMDCRNAANITFENVQVGASALMGEEGGAAAVVENTLNVARIGLSAEMLGSMSEAFERTLNYLKEREQFGVRIGTFQALQHRAAEMFCQIELCKSLVLASLQALDANSKKVPVLASMTKAKVGETLKLVTNEGVQMFAGIGMTDDEEIGFFLKRARVAEQTFGDSYYHLDRYARMNGY